jgi:hypothetical protein
MYWDIMGYHGKSIEKYAKYMENREIFPTISLKTTIHILQRVRTSISDFPELFPLYWIKLTGYLPCD